MVLNESSLRGAAAKRLDAYCAAAGEKIKKAGSFDRALDHIEHGFPHHRSCGASLSAAGRLKMKAAVFTAENAQAHRQGVFLLLQEARACLPEDIVHRKDGPARSTML